MAVATIVPYEFGVMVCHHRARIGTLLFTILRRGGRRQWFSIQLAVVAWERVSRGDDGGFTDSRRFQFLCFLFAAPWRRAASILLGLSGAFAWNGPGICCVALAFNSIWRGVSFGCDPPPFGWSRVAPRSRPYSFGMIVGVASKR